MFAKVNTVGFFRTALQYLSPRKIVKIRVHNKLCAVRPGSPVLDVAIVSLKNELVFLEVFIQSLVGGKSIVVGGGK